MTIKRKYNVAITNWNDETIMFLKIFGYEARHNLSFCNNEFPYLRTFVEHGKNMFVDSHVNIITDEILCDWQTEPDLVKALVCETDDDVARKHCLLGSMVTGEFDLSENIGMVESNVKDSAYFKTSLQSILYHFRKNKKVVEPVGVEDRKKAEINPKRMTRREFYEAISNPNEAYKQHLKMLWDNNDAKSIFEITGLNVAGMLNAKNNDIIEEKPKREPDGYICPIDIHELKIKKGTKLTIEELIGLSKLSIAKAFFTPYYKEQTIDEKIKEKLANFLLQKISKEEFVNEIKELFNK